MDPNAADAYLAAGGGVASNAIAQGGDALSTRAVLPAAQSLRVADELSQPLQLTVGNQAPIRFAGGPEEATPDIEAYRRGAMNLITQAAKGAGIGTGPGGTELLNVLAEAGILERGTQGLGGGGNPEFRIRGGGSFDAQNLAFGDDGRLVYNAPAGVNSKGEPVDDGGFIAAADGFKGVVDEPTLMLVGEAGPEAVNVAPQDEPYVNRTLAFRRDRPLSSIGSARSEFDPRFFSRLTPEQRARFAFSRQTRYGIPAEQTLFDANRFRLPGFRRDQVQIGA